MKGAGGWREQTGVGWAGLGRLAYRGEAVEARRGWRDWAGEGRLARGGWRGEAGGVRLAR